MGQLMEVGMVGDGSADGRWMEGGWWKMNEFRSEDELLEAWIDW